jgi:hypothetical protein
MLRSLPQPLPEFVELPRFLSGDSRALRRRECQALPDRRAIDARTCGCNRRVADDIVSSCATTHRITVNRSSPDAMQPFYRSRDRCIVAIRPVLRSGSRAAPGYTQRRNGSLQF